MKPKIVVALDVYEFKQAKYFIDRLCSKVKIFKIGPQLFLGCGPRVIRYIQKKKAEAFLDLKFFDIPHTVSCAVRQAVRLKVKMLTLHIQGGQVMLKQAVETAKDEARRLGLRRPLLVGVTVLTSQDATAGNVLKMARLAKESDLDGVVCSVKEAELVKKELGLDFLIISPGIRPQDYPACDQKRTATFQEAVDSGVDFVVVGRPILEADDPLEAYEQLIKP